MLGYLRHPVETLSDLRGGISLVLSVSGGFMMPCALDVPLLDGAEFAALV